MIRAKMRLPDGTLSILLGLSRENVNRLMAGNGILVKGASIDEPELEIMVIFGETEEALRDMLAREGLNQKYADMARHRIENPDWVVPPALKVVGE